MTSMARRFDRHQLVVHLVDLRPDMGGSLPHTCAVVGQLAKHHAVMIVTDRRSLVVLRRRLPLDDLRVLILPAWLRGRPARHVAEQIVLPWIASLSRSTLVWSPISITAPRCIRRSQYAVSFHDLHTGTGGRKDKVTRRAALAARKAAVLVVPSSLVAERARALRGTGQVAVVGGGGTKVEPQTAPPFLGSTPYAICLSSDQENKGHRTLAGAVQRLLVSVPGFRLVLAGSRLEPNSLDRVYADLPTECWHDLGFVGPESLGSLLLGARFLVSASSYEGFGLAMLDALVSEVPVVATRVGVLVDHPQLLPTAVPPNDPAALADAMQSSWEDSEALNQGRDLLVAAGLTWEATAERVASALGLGHPGGGERT